ncbi:MAG: hypothetical protein Q9207_005391 [Kuettlingeria erythrocarpa]
MTFKAKRKAFTAATDAPTRKKIKHNATSSPLLRLPFEIRGKIFREVIGGRVLHVEYNHWQHAEFDEYRLATWPDPDFCEQCQLTCVACVRSTAGDGGELHRSLDEWVDESSLEGCQQACTRHLQPPTRIPFGHERDSPQPWPSPRPIVERAPNHGALDPTILRCCRQLYSECNQLLLTSNVYSFTNPKVFLNFLQSLHFSRIPLLRSLQLHVSSGFQNIWERSTKTVRDMHGLTSLALILYSDMRRDNKLQMMTDPHTLHNAFHFALYFRILRLQHVRVALRPDGHAGPDSCTEQDRAAVARIIQEKIADHDGVGAHNREYEQRQVIAKARKAADAAEAEASRAERQRRKQLKDSTLRS